MRRRMLGAPNLISQKWQTPWKELDVTIGVLAGTWVYISPQSSIVTVGYTDIVAAENKKAFPGIWEAAQDVPPTDDEYYHVPQIDYPGATGTPSGSPLRGDLDGDDVYWILICPTCEL